MVKFISLFVFLNIFFSVDFHEFDEQISFSTVYVPLVMRLPLNVGINAIIIILKSLSNNELVYCFSFVCYVSCAQCKVCNAYIRPLSLRRFYFILSVFFLLLKEEVHIYYSDHFRLLWMWVNVWIYFILDQFVIRVWNVKSQPYICVC